MDSMVEARRALTMVSRYESNACRTEMGRLAILSRCLDKVFL